MKTNKDILLFIDTALTVLLCIFAFAFPLVFSLATSDPFGLPKQMILAGVVLVSIILLGIKMLVMGKMQLKTTKFDVPVLAFAGVVFLSSFFAVNRYDSLINFAVLLYAVLLYFVIVNSIRRETYLMYFLGAMVLGGALASIITILSYFQIYVLPWEETHGQYFSMFGSLLDQAMYLAIVLPLAGYVAYPLITRYIDNRHVGANVAAHAQWLPSGNQQMMMTRSTIFGAAGAVMLAGLLMTLYILIFDQKPVILPFETGFRTALAAVSQDTGNLIKSFLLGSGFGEYLTVFTRFKEATYNNNPNLWSFTFFRSSSFVLELLATTGVLGLAAFLFIVYRLVKERDFFIPMVLITIAAFILPFSTTLIVLFFMILAVFAVIEGLLKPRRYPDVEFYFVALKRGLLAAIPQAEPGHAPHATPGETQYSRILPLIVLVVLVILVGLLGYYTTQYVRSDMTFQRSLVAASQNNAQATYELQGLAIQQFPYRDTYHRVFSQTNLVIASSIAQQQQPGQEVPADVQNQILTLIQQSINFGRQAVQLAPQTALNWNNLSQIYRALIGFGENADQFSIATADQATALDSRNPQQFINLGGIYFQLGQWDNAIRQFQLAISLKQDYANAYYNLGHALENKGDAQSLQNALAAYQIVKQLVANDAENTKVIDADIAAIQAKIGQQANAQQPNVPPAEGQQDLDVDEPSAQLPERDPEEEIQGPPPPVTRTSPTPTRSVTPTGAPTPALDN